MERIFEAGFRKLTKLRSQKNLDPKDVIDGARRAMRATYQREVNTIDAHLALSLGRLRSAPTSACSAQSGGSCIRSVPWVTSGQASARSVAPGIAEALVATAIGLFAAIPAVVAYNRFSHDIDRLSIRFESFMEELFRHPAGVRCASGCARRSGCTAPPEKRNRRRSLYRRHARAAGHLHGDRADDDQRPNIDLPSVGKAAQQAEKPLR